MKMVRDVCVPTNVFVGVFAMSLFTSVANGQNNIYESDYVIKPQPDLRAEFRLSGDPEEIARARLRGNTWGVRSYVE